MSRRSWRFAVALLALGAECLGAGALASVTYQFRTFSIGAPVPPQDVHAAILETYFLTAWAVLHALLAVGGLVRPRRLWQIAFVFVQAADVSLLAVKATRNITYSDLGDDLVILSWALVPLLAALVVLASWRLRTGPQTKT